jgi:heme-degrading monooxygenase HmoA
VEPGNRERQAAGTGEDLGPTPEEENEVKIKEKVGTVEVTTSPLMFVRVWEFRVPEERADEFRAVYGLDGDWAKLFRRETGFLGTELLHSATHPNVFLTIDRWNSVESWAAFLRTWGDEYAALDRRCKSLIVSEGEIGTFQSTEVDSRARQLDSR